MLKKKDLIILKLYFNFIDISLLPSYFTEENIADDESFIRTLYKFLSTQSDISTFLYPESNFKITKESRKKIKDLLLQF